MHFIAEGMTGETSRTLCPKCRSKLLWDGKRYVCIACPYERSVEAAPKPRKPAK